MCGFCGRESTGFAYYCLNSKAIWDGKSILEDYDERSMEALDESIKLISDVVEQMSFGEYGSS
ncbi:hypothetical protein ES332_D03G155100v1 [Gossypium tomentosum]|uniref:Uncharacterized protein n=1 Tax=Gossypium tomentosum TaxID=34277 RepID=A0A5D2LRP6_GOSTO|nr:hypothetical protein ES332_D03G155100v1 [Gossypium tomentosum]